MITRRTWFTLRKRQALENMVASGFSTADFCGVAESTMRRLVSMGLACEPVQGRVRGSTENEYGITQAGRTALTSAFQ